MHKINVINVDPVSGFWHHVPIACIADVLDILTVTILSTSKWCHNPETKSTLALNCHESLKSSVNNIVIRQQASWLGFDSWQGRGIFSLHHRVRTGSGAHPPSYRMSTGAPSPGVKRLGRTTDNPLPSSGGVKSACCTSTSPYVFMAWYLSTGTTLPLLTLL